MKISFHGAGEGVTGSCHLLDCAGKRVLIDCGMYQGGRELAEENADEFGFDRASIDFLLLTMRILTIAGAFHFWSSGALAVRPSLPQHRSSWHGLSCWTRRGCRRKGYPCYFFGCRAYPRVSQHWTGTGGRRPPALQCRVCWLCGAGYAGSPYHRRRRTSAYLW